jgi:hypothetical protein
MDINYKIIKEYGIDILKNVNAVLCYLPILIIISWIFQYALVYTQLWKDNYNLVNGIDTYVCWFSLIHIGIFRKIYLKESVVCFVGIQIINLLVYIDQYFSLSNDNFYSFYKWIIILTIAVAYNYKRK